MRDININKKGFTLIETMITLTVLSALTALAVPAYQNYSIKSQVAEAFTATDTLKKSVEEQKALSNRFNIDLVKITSDSLKIDENGNVFYIFKNKNKEINNKLVMFYLDDTENSNVFRWNCLSDLDKKYLPSSANCIIDSEDSNNIDNGKRDTENVNNKIILNEFTIHNDLKVLFSNADDNRPYNESFELRENGEKIGYRLFSFIPFYDENDSDFTGFRFMTQSMIIPSEKNNYNITETYDIVDKNFTSVKDLQDYFKSHEKYGDFYDDIKLSKYCDSNHFNYDRHKNLC